MSPAVVADEGEMCHLTAGYPVSDTYLKDQLDAYRNVTDLHIACSDGNIPVHRYIIMAASPFLMNLLIDRDPAELVVIHLDEVDIKTVTQIMSLLYTGKTVVSTKDQIPIFSTMKSLGISVQNILFRRAVTSDSLEPVILRHSSYPSKTNCSKKDIRPEIKSVNVAKIKKKGTKKQKLKSGKVVHRAKSEDIGLPTVTLPSTIFADDEFQCLTCLTCFGSETSLINHLTRKCASHLKDKFVYAGRRCLVCSTNRVADTIWGLLSHVEVCTPPPPVLKKEVEAANNSSQTNSTLASTSSILATDTPDFTNEATEEADHSVKVKKKRRRRRIAAYNTTKRRKPKKRDEKDDGQFTPASNGSIADPDDRDSSDNDHETNTPEEPNSSVGVGYDGPLKLKEQEDHQDVIRNYLGVSSAEEISQMSEETSLFYRVCAICQNQFTRIRDVEKCLKFHGYQLCWVCLKLLPYAGAAFDTHYVTEHCIDQGESVKCPFCEKHFEYKVELPTHLGNVHSQWSPPIDTKTLSDESPSGKSNKTCFHGTSTLKLDLSIDSSQETTITRTTRSSRSTPTSTSPNSSKNNIEPNTSKLRDILTSARKPMKTPVKVFEISPPSQSDSQRRVGTRYSSSDNNDHSADAPSKRPRIIGNEESKSIVDFPNLDNELQNPNSETIRSDQQEPNRRGSISTDENTKTSNDQSNSSPGRKFLRKSFINGVMYNIYCSNWDPKRIIAIPDNEPN